MIGLRLDRRGGRDTALDAVGLGGLLAVAGDGIGVDRAQHGGAGGRRLGGCRDGDSRARGAGRVGGAVRGDDARGAADDGVSGGVGERETGAPSGEALRGGVRDAEWGGDRRGSGHAVVASRVVGEVLGGEVVVLPDGGGGLGAIEVAAAVGGRGRRHAGREVGEREQVFGTDIRGREDEVCDRGAGGGAVAHGSHGGGGRWRRGLV